MCQELTVFHSDWFYWNIFWDLQCIIFLSMSFITLFSILYQVCLLPEEKFYRSVLYYQMSIFAEYIYLLLHLLYKRWWFFKVIICVPPLWGSVRTKCSLEVCAVLCKVRLPHPPSLLLEKQVRYFFSCNWKRETIRNVGDALTGLYSCQVTVLLLIELFLIVTIIFSIHKCYYIIAFICWFDDVSLCLDTSWYIFVIMQEKFADSGFVIHK